MGSSGLSEFVNSDIQMLIILLFPRRRDMVTVRVRLSVLTLSGAYLRKNVIDIIDGGQEKGKAQKT